MADELDALFSWQEPAAFDLLARQLRDRAGFGLWSDRRYKRLQEALSLGIFCRAIGVRRCRLLVDDPPDAEIESIDGPVRRVEITIALTNGRKIVDEYRAEERAASGPKLVGEEAMRHAEGHWRHWVLQRVKRKLAKAEVPTFDDLLVYNNVSNLFRTDDWPLLAADVEHVVPAGWLGGIWQHGSRTVDRLWPDPQRFAVSLEEQ